MYHYICEKCGASLDPGEKCDCDTQTNKEKKECAVTYEKLFVPGKDGKQYVLNFMQSSEVNNNG